MAGVWADAAIVPPARSRINAVCFITFFELQKVLDRSVSGGTAGIVFFQLILMSMERAEENRR